jgi:hypothetical protein
MEELERKNREGETTIASFAISTYAGCSLALCVFSYGGIDEHPPSQPSVSYLIKQWHDRRWVRGP